VTVLVWLGVAALGGLGALLRFQLDEIVQLRLGGELPIGTLVVNAVGTFALGFLRGLSVTGDDLLVVGTAMLGSFTTFSTWMLETERLAEEGDSGFGIVNVVGSTLVGVAAAAAGWALGAAL